MNEQYAPEWDQNMGLTWSGRWHVIDVNAPKPAYSHWQEQAIALCGAYIYIREGFFPKYVRRLRSIASGKVKAPICKKCTKKVNA